MVYILTADVFDEERGDSAFERYKAYLEAVRERFPPSAYDLAASVWYHDFSDHRCPHDAWLEQLTIRELGGDNRSESRHLEIVIRLLGAYHDGHIEFRYKGVTAYRCELDAQENDFERGHRDWRYDEFRLSDSGRLVHEIEWAGQDSTGTWVIEASDVAFSWLPRGT